MSVTYIFKNDSNQNVGITGIFRKLATAKIQVAIVRLYRRYSATKPPL